MLYGRRHTNTGVLNVARAVRLIRMPLVILPLLFCLVFGGVCWAAAPPQWSEEQVGNARTITETALKMGVGERGAAIAVMTAIQETTLRNLNYGDGAGPDSRGLFQQRDTWGSLEARTYPPAATSLFVAEMKKINYWNTDPGWVAQQVQVSAYPDAYADHWKEAVDLVNRVKP